MSYDEIPPDSASNRDMSGEPNSEREPSAADAPPAAPTRPKRAKAAGTDAASKSAEPTAPPEVKTSRAPRARRKSLAETETQAEIVADAAPPAPVKPTRAKTKPTPPPIVADAAAPEVAPTMASSAASEDSAPARRRRAPRKASGGTAPAGEAQNAPASNAPVEPSVAPPARPTRRRAVPAETETPVSEPKADSQADAPRTRRRAPRRAPADAAPQAADAANTEIDATAAPALDASGEGESGPDSERAPRRRRAPRSRRRATGEPSGSEAIASEAETSGEAEGAAVAGAVTDETTSAALPPTPEAGEDEAETSPRARRNRRSGRARRGAGKGETVAASDADETGTALADEDGRGSAVAPSAPAPYVEPAPVIDRSVGAHLIPRHGLPEIHVNGVVYPPVLFFGNLEGAGERQRVVSEARRAARAGVHLHSTLIDLPCPLSESSDALDVVDARLRTLLDADPDGFVMPRVVFVPARGWRREYPTDIAAYADNSVGDPSIASDRFWQEAEHSLQTLIAHLRGSAWDGRVFGYHLERGEWFQPADLGYDRSVANRDAFRDWLREKYQNNLILLRAAWYDGQVQFHTAEIPQPPVKPAANRAFFETRRERRTIDFYEFTSEITARRLTALAKTVKKACDYQALVSVCYGYTFEFGHGFSGHLALAQLEASPYIDLICGPPSYRDRKPGGAASLPAPVESPPLYGKLWLSEDDTKTYLAPLAQDPDDFNPRLATKEATEQAQARAMGKALTHTTGVGWMDLWGEGWLDEDSVWERLGAFTTRYKTFLDAREWERVPEVVALVDEKSLLHVQRGEPFFRKLTNGLRDTLQRAGVSYGTYLQSDVLADAFPTDARLYLFLTPYRLTTEQRAAIKEKLQTGGKTLAFLYAPGSCEERPALSGGMEESATGAIGISVRQQAWNSEVGSRVVEPKHLITERLIGREIGVKEVLNPSFYVEDAEATVLAEYQGSGLPSLAARDFGTWKSVFVGDPALPLELLRGICRYAGVHLWTPQGDDITEVGNGWLTIHATRDGQRTLRLPGATGLYDLTDSRLIADETRDYRFFLRAGMTRAFCIGPTARLQKLGLPNITLPTGDPDSIAGARARIVLDTPGEADAETEMESAEEAAEPPTGLPPISLPADRSADLETLKAILSLSPSQINDAGLDMETDEDDEDALAEAPTAEASGAESGELLANGRRRRRRGGRGRGRKRDDETNGTAPTDGDASGGLPALNGAVGDDLPAPERFASGPIPGLDDVA